MSPNGTLRFRLAPNASGRAVISVVGTDDFVGGPTSRPGVNDAPDPVHGHRRCRE